MNHYLNLRRRWICFLFVIVLGGFSEKPLWAADSFMDLGCGNEGEKPCSFLGAYWWQSGSGGCDRGLISWNGQCQNSSRHLPEVATYRQSWNSWAWSYQKKLAFHLPINQTIILSAHNSMANWADKPRFLPIPYRFLNQRYSMSDQLDLGIRWLDIDIHRIRGHVRTCHGNDAYPVYFLDGSKYPIGCLPTERFYFDALKEIRNWLNRPENLEEIIILSSEDYINPQHGGIDDEVNLPIERFLGELVFTPSMLEDSSRTWKQENRWPTSTELLSIGKRVIYLNRNTHGGRWLHRDSDWRSDNYSTQGITVNELRNSHCSEDLDLRRTNKFVYITEDRSYGQKQDYIGIEDVRKAIACNIGIFFDKVDAFDARLRASIWTWTENDREIEGTCIQLVHTGNEFAWKSVRCEQDAAYACMNSNREWKITQTLGPSVDGHTVCKIEFPGYFYSLPRIYSENQKLIREMNRVRSNSVWMK